MNCVVTQRKKRYLDPARSSHVWSLSIDESFFMLLCHVSWPKSLLSLLKFQLLLQPCTQQLKTLGNNLLEVSKYLGPVRPHVSGYVFKIRVLTQRIPIVFAGPHANAKTMEIRQHRSQTKRMLVAYMMYDIIVFNDLRSRSSQTRRREASVLKNLHCGLRFLKRCIQVTVFTRWKNIFKQNRIRIDGTWIYKIAVCMVC